MASCDSLSVSLCVFLAQAIVISVLFIINWFAGAIFFAVRSSTWLEIKKAHDKTPKDIKNLSLTKIMSNSAATSVRIVLALWYLNC